MQPKAGGERKVSRECMESNLLSVSGSLVLDGPFAHTSHICNWKAGSTLVLSADSLFLLLSVLNEQAGSMGMVFFNAAGE